MVQSHFGLAYAHIIDKNLFPNLEVIFLDPPFEHSSKILSVNFAKFAEEAINQTAFCQFYMSLRIVHYFDHYNHREAKSRK